MRKIEDFLNKKKKTIDQKINEIIKVTFKIPHYLIYPISSYLPILNQLQNRNLKCTFYPAGSLINKNTTTTLYYRSPIEFNQTLSVYVNLESISISNTKILDFSFLSESKILKLELENIKRIINLKPIKTLRKITFNYFLNFIDLKNIIKLHNLENISISNSNFNDCFDDFKNLICNQKYLKIVYFENLNLRQNQYLNLNLQNKFYEFSYIENSFKIQISFINKSVILRNSMKEFMNLNFNEMESLEIYDSMVDFNNLQVSNSLKKLVISNCTFENRDFVGFINKLDSIVHIDISYSSISLFNINLIVKRFKYSLKYLNFSGIEIFYDFLKNIKNELCKCNIVYVPPNKLN